MSAAVTENEFFHGARGGERKGNGGPTAQRVTSPRRFIDSGLSAECLQEIDQRCDAVIDGRLGGCPPTAGIRSTARVLWGACSAPGRARATTEPPVGVARSHVWGGRAPRACLLRSRP